MKPQVWVVSELYYPEETSTGYFLTGIAEGLARSFATGVICSPPTYAARSLRVAPSEERNGVLIIRCPSTRLNPRMLLYRLINALTMAASIGYAVFRRVRRGHKVIVVTNPPLLPWVVRAAAVTRGASCVLLVHDVYPEVLAAAGLLRPNSLLYRLLRRMAHSLYRGFREVVVLGRDMQELVAQKLRATDRPPRVIPNWGDIESVTPVAGVNPIRDRLGLAGKFVVQYAGNIGRTHDIELVLQAARRLSESQVHFLIIGSGSRENVVKTELGRGSLPNVTFVPSVARDALGLWLTACDVAIVCLRPGMKGVSVPSRVYNILAAGTPLIATTDEGSELALLLREENVGWAVAPGDLEAFADAIAEAQSNPSLLREMASRARRAAERRYSRASVIEAWTDLVRKLP